MEDWAGLLVPYRNRPAREKPSELLAYVIKTVEQEEDEEDDEVTLTEACWAPQPRRMTRARKRNFVSVCCSTDMLDFLRHLMCKRNFIR